MDRPSPPPAIIYQDHALCCAHWHNVQICICVKALSISHVDIYERAFVALGQRYPKGVLGLTVLVPHSPLSETAVIRRAQESRALLYGTVVHMAVAIEFTGVWNTLVKAIFRSLIVASRLSREVQLYDSIDAACRTLVPMVRETAATTISAAELAAVVHLLKESLAAGTALPAPAPR